MTTDQQIEQLKWAAVAMGYEGEGCEHCGHVAFRLDGVYGDYWQPHLLHEDNDVMGAELGIDVVWLSDSVEASHYDHFREPGLLEVGKRFKDHNNSKSQALLAARMAVAEQIGKMKGEK